MSGSVEVGKCVALWVLSLAALLFRSGLFEVNRTPIKEDMITNSSTLTFTLYAYFFPESNDQR